MLKAPDIPSILIETAFISNYSDENLLRQDSFRDNIVSAISTAIIDYFALKTGSITNY